MPSNIRPQARRWRFRCGGANDVIHVEVTDHGEGIPEKEQRHIFERFFRSPSVLHQIPGSGLGLSIAHGILRAHHGDLTVHKPAGQNDISFNLACKLWRRTF